MPVPPSHVLHPHDPTPSIAAPLPAQPLVAPADVPPGTCGPTPHQAPPPAATLPTTQHQIATEIREQLSHLGMDSSSDSEEDKRPKTRKSRRLKSGRVWTTHDHVVKEMPWPHIGVFKGPNRVAATYDSLSLPEFVFGYLGSLRKISDQSLHAHMLHHLRELMQDAISYPWQNVRNYHAVVLAHLEHADITWEDRETIQELRHTYARTTTGAPAGPSRQRAAPDARQGTPCSEWQQGNYSQQATHDHQLHVCAWCWQHLNRTHKHQEQACQIKAREA